MDCNKCEKFYARGGECGGCLIDATGSNSALSDVLSDNRELRKLLWLTHGCISLYGDDGELQCNCGPHRPIDFKRDSVEDIKTKLLKLGR